VLLPTQVGLVPSEAPGVGKLKVGGVASTFRCTRGRKCNWYRTLFADCFGTLGNFYFQYAVVEASFNLVLVDRIREPEGTLEAAVAALHHAIILLLLIVLVLLLTSDGQDAVLEGERDILLVDPRKFGLNYDFLIGLRPYVG
jgi:hypothetical protein